jgi:hypothetical protein
MPTKKYSIKGPLAERLEEAAENEEMSSEDLLDYIVRRYLDDLWVCEEESDEEESENEEET